MARNILMQLRRRGPVNTQAKALAAIRERRLAQRSEVYIAKRRKFSL